LKPARPAQPSPHVVVLGALIEIWHGRPASIVSFTIQDGKIVAIDILADPARIRQLISRSS
jgi:hypothetical protein